MLDFIKLQRELCSDFFGVSTAGFNAIKPLREGRVTKFSYGGNRDIFTFTFWPDSVLERFDPVDSAAHFTIEKKAGVVSGFEISNGKRGADINATNIKSFVADGSRLFYGGPFSADSDDTITIDVVLCQK